MEGEKKKRRRSKDTQEELIDTLGAEKVAGVLTKDNREFSIGGMKTDTSISTRQAPKSLEHCRECQPEANGWTRAALDENWGTR